MGRPEHWRVHPTVKVASSALPGVWPEPDPARARELVQEYLDEGNSFPSDITLLTSNIRTAEAEIIQQAMGSVGIDVTIEVLPIPEYVDKQKAHGFDLVYSGVSPFSAGPRQWFRNSHPDRRYTHNDPNPSAELAENIATAEAAFDDDARVAASKWLQQYKRRQLHDDMVRAPDHRHLWQVRCDSRRSIRRRSDRGRPGHMAGPIVRPRT